MQAADRDLEEQIKAARRRDTLPISSPFLVGYPISFCSAVALFWMLLLPWAAH